MASISNFDSGIGQAACGEEWASFVLEALDNESVLLSSGATRVDTSNKIVHVPHFTDNGTADFYDELDQIGAGDPAGTDLELHPWKCAALTTLSREVVADSNAGILDQVGRAMTRAVALKMDEALFVGGGGGTIGPDGIMNYGGTLQNVNNAGTITYANIVTAGGSISAYGGRADSLYMNPADFTTLQLATAGDDRPLIQPDASQGAAATVAGYRVYPTPALGAGTALLAEAAQIVVAVRNDADVVFSEDSLFDYDAVQARVTARVDAGVADPNGLCTIS